MFRFVLKRVMYGFLVLFGVVTVIFFLFNSKGGDPTLALAGNNATPEVIASIKRDLGLDLPLSQRYVLYLNDLSPISIHNPTVEQSRIYYDQEEYGGFELFGLSENRTVVMKAPYLRRSYENKQLVAEMIADKLPDTAILAVLAIFFATIFGIALGIFSALKKGTFYDNASFIFAVSGMSSPSFFLAAIISNVGGYVWAEQLDLPVFPVICGCLGLMVGVVWFFTTKDLEARSKIGLSTFVSWVIKGGLIGTGVWLVYVAGMSIFNFEEFPIIGTSVGLPGTGLDPTGPFIDIDDATGDEIMRWDRLILPVITLGIRPLAIVTQLTRSSMLDVLSLDYIRTARAKGLSNFKVIVKHALKNALNPVVTAISSWFASLLAGAVFIEIIFNYNGLGFKMVHALQHDDLPIVMGSVLVISSSFVVINILVDIAYGFLDPRVRVQ